MKIDLIRKVIKLEMNYLRKRWVPLSKLIWVCRENHNIIISIEDFTSNPNFRVNRTTSEIYIGLTEDLLQICHSILKGNIQPIPSLFAHKESSINDNPFKECLSKINNTEDLEKALVIILNDLGAVSLDKSIDVATLNQHFYEVYREPIKIVLNTFISDIKLIEYLQYYYSFNLNKVEEKWRIFLNNSLYS